MGFREGAEEGFGTPGIARWVPSRGIDFGRGVLREEGEGCCCGFGSGEGGAGAEGGAAEDDSGGFAGGHANG